MSRIGRMVIAVPQGVQVAMEGTTFVSKGPKGQHRQPVHPEMAVEIAGSEVRVTRPTEQTRHRALHGLTRTLVANSVRGVSTGFIKKLEIRGVGYKAEVQGRKLMLSVGYSNPVEFPLPEGIDVKAEAPTLLAVSGVDKQQVGQVAAEIRGIRPPEPYKGKGIRYEGEHVRQKAGKTAGK
ncbi:MAG TPA: 50S ribosomal protein L6 [Candidatus Krumholzibacteria bacterium]|jgi:large subunit ribosomal protein L6|nr:50S ribosomal protein L6 [Candidatus Krumholzibacteria bacterium]